VRQYHCVRVIAGLFTLGDLLAALYAGGRDRRRIVGAHACSATVTDAGWLLAEHAATLLAGTEQAEPELAAQAGTIGGQRTINTVPSLATSVSVALAAVQQQHLVDVLMRQIDSVDAVRAVGTHLSDVAIVDE
jgi:DNA-binding transcriptional LysR family regulator